METRLLGKTGMKVSAACLGAMTFGREADEAESRRILDRYAEAGGYFIDTADLIYSGGASEEIVGRWLQDRGRRSEWVVATKVAFPTGPTPADVGLSRKHIFDAIEGSLRRLRTDYVDLYQIHWWDGLTPVEETLEALDSLVKAGKTRYIGASNVASWQLMKALAESDRRGLARFVCLQPMYSLLVRQPDIELLPLCRREGLGAIAYSPLARGELTGKRPAEDRELPSGAASALDDASWRRLRETVEIERRRRIVRTVESIAKDRGVTAAQVALAWVSAQPGMTAPILGARSVDQLNDNLGFLGWRLSPDEMASLNAASDPGRPYPHDYLDYIAAQYERSDNS